MKNNRDFPLRTAGVAAVIAVLLLVLSILGKCPDIRLLKGQHGGIHPSCRK